MYLFLASALLAQGKDSLLFKSSRDSSAVKDTTSKKKYDVDTVIYSSASDSLIFYVDKKKMDLYGEAENCSTRKPILKVLRSLSTLKLSNIDAAGRTIRFFPGKFKGTPILVDKGETYDGITMKFNFKTSRGFISKAASKLEGAYL